MLSVQSVPAFQDNGANDDIANKGTQLNRGKKRGAKGESRKERRGEDKRRGENSNELVVAASADLGSPPSLIRRPVGVAECRLGCAKLG